jgi:ADP-ribose pyrophosphatase
MFRAIGRRKTAEPKTADLEASETLFLSRDELLAGVAKGEIHLLAQIALVSMVWQREIADALSGSRETI